MLCFHCCVEKEALCPVLILIIWCAAATGEKKKWFVKIQLNLDITESLKLALYLLKFRSTNVSRLACTNITSLLSNCKHLSATLLHLADRSN